MLGTSTEIITGIISKLILHVWKCLSQTKWSELKGSLGVKRGGEGGTKRGPERRLWPHPPPSHFRELPAALLNLALPSLWSNQTPSAEGPDRPVDVGGRGRSRAHWDAECISNPSVSVSSLSGDIITITAAGPLGEAGKGAERRRGPTPSTNPAVQPVAVVGGFTKQPHASKSKPVRI